MELKLTYSKKSDEDLWNDFRHGDQEAFSALYYLNIQSMLGYASKFTHNQPLIEDCIQELFLDLWKKGQNNPQVKSVKAYLFAATRNRILKKLNRSQVFSSLDDFEFDFPFQLSIENEMIMDESKKEVKMRLKKCLQELPSLQKEVIYLKFYFNFSIEEISEMLQLNRKSVYNALSKAMIHFRKHFSMVTLFFFVALLLLNSLR